MLSRRHFALACLPPPLLTLAGCATAPTADQRSALPVSAWTQATRLPDGGPWQHQILRGRKITRYAFQSHHGRPALHAYSEAGDSLVRYRLQVPAESVSELRFSWWVPRLNTEVDLTEREREDAVVRVILSFDGDRQRMSPRDHMVSELAQLLTGEPLPYATLMYVWDPHQPVGAVIEHPSTRRIRKLVVESGTARLGQWVDLGRDIQADFQQVFGETPQNLTGLALMTDSNNTRQTVEAWYGPLQLGQRAGPR